MNHSLSILAAALALGACNQSPQPSVAEQNQARADRAARTFEPDQFAAGRWETKTAIGSVSNSGLSASGKAEVVAQESAIDQCLPADEVRRPDANFFAGGDGSECQYSKYAVADGRLNATLNCTATPGSIVMTLAGTYTPTSYALNATATNSGGPGAAPSTTTAKLSGTWLGPCGDPDQQRAPEDPAR